jgi:hypothetical protein
MHDILAALDAAGLLSDGEEVPQGTEGDVAQEIFSKNSKGCAEPFRNCPKDIAS